MTTVNSINLYLQGVPYYDGAGTFTAANTATANQILLSAANAVPSFLTTGANGVFISSNGSVPSWLANGTAGYVLTANSGAGPSWQAAGVSNPALITNFTTYTSGTPSATAAGGNSYIVKSAVLTLTLPLTSSVGDIFEVTIDSASIGGSWQINQNANQAISIATTSTSAGTGGYLASLDTFSTVQLRCTTANLYWTSVSSQGELTTN